MTNILAACILLTAQAYSLPPAVLTGIYQVESGAIGAETGPNKNGSYDLGPMQINTVWIPYFSKKWNLSNSKTRQLIRDNPCYNAKAAAQILKNHLKETKSISKAISHYHSRTPSIGTTYKKKVILAMLREGLLRSE